MMGMINNRIKTGFSEDFDNVWNAEHGPESDEFNYKGYHISKADYDERHAIWKIDKELRKAFWDGTDPYKCVDKELALRRKRIEDNAKLRDIFSGAAANRQAKAERRAEFESNKAAAKARREAAAAQRAAKRKENEENAIANGEQSKRHYGVHEQVKGKHGKNARARQAQKKGKSTAEGGKTVGGKGVVKQEDKNARGFPNKMPMNPFVV